MKIIGVIPARYNASRLPGKLLKKIGEKSVIIHSYENIKKMNLLDEVIVATDHQEIANQLKKVGATVVMTSPNHQSGSDRIAEAVKNIACDVVINIQGDEPFVDVSGIKSLVEAFRNDINHNVQIASLMTAILDQEEIKNPNNVKVVFNKNREALYFSRSVIPYDRSGEGYQYYKHIGVYAFRKKTLLEFVDLPSSSLEAAEKLEQLRLLENNYKIHMFETSKPSIGIDTEEDLEKAIKFYNEKNI